jgi:hypothetical protein
MAILCGLSRFVVLLLCADSTTDCLAELDGEFFDALSLVSMAPFGLGGERGGLSWSDIVDTSVVERNGSSEQS